MAAYPEVIHLEIDVALGATTDENYYFGALLPSGATYKVQSAGFLPRTNVAAHSTTTRILTLSDGTTTFGTLTTDSDVTGYTAYTAGTYVPMTLSGACEIVGGTSVLKLAATHGSTGAVGDGMFVVELVKMGV